MIVWVLVFEFWGYGGGLHRSAPYYDEVSCSREAARIVGRAMAAHETIAPAVYCEQVKIPAAIRPLKKDEPK